jgi:hypothetical protein
MLRAVYQKFKRSADVNSESTDPIRAEEKQYSQSNTEQALWANFLEEEDGLYFTDNHRQMLDHAIAYLENRCSTVLLRPEEIDGDSTSLQSTLVNAATPTPSLAKDELIPQAALLVVIADETLPALELLPGLYCKPRPPANGLSARRVEENNSIDALYEKMIGFV